MEAIGIIAEYNPFHKGHLYHLQATKKAVDLPIIVAMSGSIMQRGEPAFADKWLRARMAVECGVDLVLELPTAFCLRSAEYFARGGVDLLQATGIVKYLSCGAEDTKVNYNALAHAILASNTQNCIHQLLQQGLPYAKACQQALQTQQGFTQLAEVAAKPNNILALEYAKALLKTDIQQIIIGRSGSNYNDTELTALASASAIRQAYCEATAWQSAVPKAVADLMCANKESLSYNEEKLWSLLNYKLRTSSAEAILNTTECTEGLENLLLNTANAACFKEAVAMCTNKRYPASRIRRLFLQLLMSKPKVYFQQKTPAYLRVLAFNTTGRQLLAEMKQKANLPIITKLGRNPLLGQSQSFQQQLELDLTASDITALLKPNQQATATDYITSPYYNR